MENTIEDSLEKGFARPAASGTTANGRSFSLLAETLWDLSAYHILTNVRLNAQS